MEVQHQNLLEIIQGKWNCIKATQQAKDEELDLNFTILISENLISRNGDGKQYWPDIYNFELVGSIKDGYFYREDGCFIQIKPPVNEQLSIELSHKSEDGDLNQIIFNFEREQE